MNYVCKKCGEEISGPDAGVKDAIKRHDAKKHKAVKK